MKIQPIVEGHGDVAAIPILLRRIMGEMGVGSIGVGKPIRWKRTQIVRETELGRAVQLARSQPECGAILIVFDADDDCPKELATQVETWAKHAAGGAPCSVVMPCREYEAWLLAAIASLRGKRGIRADAAEHSDPESVRDAKGEIDARKQARGHYSETIDQAALTASFDMRAAYRACRSFRRMVSALAYLAAQSGISPQPWP